MPTFTLQNVDTIQMTSTEDIVTGTCITSVPGGMSVGGYVIATAGVSAGNLRLKDGSIISTTGLISFGGTSISSTGGANISGGVSLSGGVSINGHRYPTSLGTSQFLYYKNATTGVSGYGLSGGTDISLSYGENVVTINSTGGGGGGNVFASAPFSTENSIIVATSTGSRNILNRGVTIDNSNNITTTGGVSAGGGMSAGTLVLNSGIITDTSNPISFGTNNLITAGGLSVLDVTFFNDTSSGQDIIQGSGGLTIGGAGTSGTTIFSPAGGVDVIATGGPVTIATTNTIGTTIQGLLFPLNIDSSGSPGQVLQTNGSGTLSFVDNGGGGGTSLGSLTDASNTTTSDNLFLGYKPVSFATGSANNIAVGVSALYPILDPVTNINGSNNIAVGFNALLNGSRNNSMNDNIAIGSNTLLTPGSNSARNIAIGTSALTELTTGTSNNVAIGYLAGSEITTGYQNTIVGSSAGITTTTGINNTIIGFGATASASGVSNEFTLGNGSVTSLRCADATIASLSDARDKNDIRDLPYGLNFLENVRPVEFTWDKRVLTPDDENDPKQGKRRAGFIAQELQEAMPDGENDILDLVYESNPQRLEAKYGNLIPVMVKAIQDLKAEVDTLKNHLNLE